MNIDDSKILGANIRRIRTDRKLKQIEVIARLEIMGVNISSSAYTKLEAGVMNPRVSVLIALTEVLSCDFNDLFQHE